MPEGGIFVGNGQLPGSQQDLGNHFGETVMGLAAQVAQEAFPQRGQRCGDLLAVSRGARDHAVGENLLHGLQGGLAARCQRFERGQAVSQRGWLNQQLKVIKGNLAQGQRQAAARPACHQLGWHHGLPGNGFAAQQADQQGYGLLA